MKTLEKRLEEVKEEYTTALKSMDQLESDIAKLRSDMDRFVKKQAPELVEEFEVTKRALTKTNQAYKKSRREMKEIALMLFDETGKKDLNGLKIKKFVDEDGHLEVHELAAIQWAVNRGFTSLLKLDMSKYETQLRLDTMPDMPGKIAHKETEYRPYVYNNTLIEHQDKNA